MTNPFSTVIDQMASVGITGLQEHDLLADGKLHRFQPDDSKSRTAWYVLHEYAARNGDLLLYGRFGDWRITEPSGIKIEPKGVKLSDAERDEFRKVQERKRREQARERQDRARRAALRAKKVWDKLTEQGVAEAIYLKKKQVRPYGVRLSPKGAVVVPVHDIGGDIHGLQFIHEQPRKNQDGDWIGKDFWPFGMDPKAHFHQIGEIPDSGASGRVLVVICEGYATGASIHEATGLPVFVAFNRVGLLPAAKVIRETWPEAQIYIAADDDYLTTKPIENPGVTDANKAAKAVRGQVIIPKFQNRTDQRWTDFNDLHVQDGLEAVKDQVMRAVYGEAETSTDKKQKGKSKPVFPEIPEGEEWRYSLAYTQTGKPQATINNTRLVLANDERWQGVLGYCDFSYAVVKLRPPPFADNADTGEWSDADTARLRCWLAEHYEFSPKNGDADEAVLVAAQAHRFHPVRDYLNGLKWDGNERLVTWLADYLGAECTEYTQAVGLKWLVGAVARVMEPGCKMDNVPILESGQGRGKSTALRVLGGEWFSDTHFDLGSKDAYQQLRGVWLYEMAELDAFNKAESTRAKAFFSAQEDNYRPSYGRRTIKAPRQSVVSGSTNQDHYLKDVTGNRRYWPVRCTEININSLREARDQLWAEAVHEYRKGTPWHVMPHEREHFEFAQEDRFQEDVWESVIIEWLDEPEQKMIKQFSGADIMIGALRMTPDKMKPPEFTRVGLIMKRLGWEKKRRRAGPGRTVWVYERPKDEEGDLRSYAGSSDPPM